MNIIIFTMPKAKRKVYPSGGGRKLEREVLDDSAHARGKFNPTPISGLDVI